MQYSSSCRSWLRKVVATVRSRVRPGCLAFGGNRWAIRRRSRIQRDPSGGSHPGIDKRRSPGLRARPGLPVRWCGAWPHDSRPDHPGIGLRSQLSPSGHGRQIVPAFGCDTSLDGFAIAGRRWRSAAEAPAQHFRNTGASPNVRSEAAQWPRLRNQWQTELLPKCRYQT